MAKTEFIRARVDARLKENTEILFFRLGLTMSEAITLFLSQCEMRQGLPFEVSIPTNKNRILDAIKRKDIPNITLSTDESGRAFIDKDKHPDLYDWAENG